MKNQRVRVGGVPEHFNLPWHFALENQRFAQAGLDVGWQNEPGGTGAMMELLRLGQLDVAIALTEGVVAEITKNNSCKMAQYYVTSPLTWGVHVAAASSHQSIDDLENTMFAISRFGSGSHLMAYVMAQTRGWDTQALSFVVVGNLDGARTALASEKAQGFMWEKFTTQPLVSQGEFRRVGTFDTPWPCFVVAVRQEFLEHHQDSLMILLQIINQATQDFRVQPNAVPRIAAFSNLSEEKAQEWLARTVWANGRDMERGTLEHVVKALYDLSLIERMIEPEALWMSG